MDKVIEYNERSVHLYKAIDEYYSAGYSKRQISKMLHCSRNTVTKYLNGDYDALCRRDFRSSVMDQFYDYVIKSLNAGISRKDIYRSILIKGYKGGQTAAYDYMNKVIERFQIDIAVYKSSSAEAVQKRKNCKSMIIYSEAAYSVFCGWRQNSQPAIKHIYCRHTQNSGILWSASGNFAKYTRREICRCCICISKNIKRQN